MLASTKVMDALKGIGLNLYERKLWVALLSRGTSTAGELSEIANIPRSRAYDILQSLAAKGFVVIQTAKPIRFVAINPEEALERAKKKYIEEMKAMEKRFDELKESSVMRELNEIYTKGMKMISLEEITGALRGKYSLHQQLGTMINAAGKRINIITTPEGLNELYENHFDALKKAKEKGVEIKVAAVVNDRCADALKALNSIANIRKIDEKELEISGRIHLVDGKEVLLGLTDPKAVHDTQDISFWSRSEHAAGKVFEPLFKLIWNNSKPVG
jgi:sugar-specific transcriptional regulator TrmB